jgi:hypothetical protein
MRVITVTSDNYLPQTRALLESLRVWHAAWPVTAYALATGWTAAHTATLQELGAQVEVWPEPDPGYRAGGIGTPLFPIWKLEVLAGQREPFLLLDGDCLILRPLDAPAAAVAATGWFAVHDRFPLADLHWGVLADLSGLPHPPADCPAFHAAVLGADPGRYGDVLALARQWAGQLPRPYYTDQALLNLAWHKLHGRAPADAGWAWCAPVYRGGRFDLGSAILHCAGPYVRGVAESKAQYQLRVWSHWPRGTVLRALAETDFWRGLGPLPWAWPNQRNQHRHRGFVRQARRESRSLNPIDGLIVADATQAYLLDQDVLDQLDAWWRRAAPSFQGLPHVPTYHLFEGGAPAPRARACRRWDDLLALIPRRSSAAEFPARQAHS